MTTLRIISWGGIGDAILTTPCFRAFKRAHPQGRLKVFWRHPGHRAVFQGNTYIDVLKPARFVAAPVEFLRYLRKPAEYVLPAYGQIRPALFPRQHATLIMADILGLTLTDLKPDLVLTEAEDRRACARLAPYQTPVAIHVTAACSANKNWPIAYWDALVRENPDCSFLQLGHASEPEVRGSMDLRGLTLRDTLAIVKHARSFVGVDSGLQHAAAAFGTPGVAIFGASLPMIWGHATNINLYSGDMACAPCIDILKNAPCPYGQPCMQAIRPEAVAAALRTQLARPRAVDRPLAGIDGHQGTRTAGPGHGR